MQRTFIILCLMVGTMVGYSQQGYQPRYPFEIGLEVGTSQFLGDLGGQKGIGTPFLRDTDFKMIKPTVGVFARYNFGAHFAVRLGANFLMVAGDDKYASVGDKGFSATELPSERDEAWYRWIRNLHFRSRVWEASLMAEVIPYNIELGGGYYGYSVLAPYAAVGIGIFNFRPQANYNGGWYDLKPLHTEGQGFVDGRAPYALTQVNLPLALGLKWIYNDTWSLALEVNHRITFTDYIDDVSTDYIDPTIFTDNLDASTAELATELANRSLTQQSFPGIHAPDQQRGDPKDNDSYYTITLRFSYYIDPGSVGSGRRYGCPVW